MSNLSCTSEIQTKSSCFACNFTRFALNLPSMIEFGNNSYIFNTYSAAGEKLMTQYQIQLHPVLSPQAGEGSTQEAGGVSEAKTENTRSGSVTPIDTDHIYYCGDVVYDRGVTRLLTDEGYVTFSETGAPIYHYYLRDHVGNIRVVMGQTGTVEQVNHYYAFGGLMRESTNPGLQPYKYGGKEIDRSSGLDAYDFGARSYFADRMQWGSMDRLAEKKPWQSPYVYGRNNPLRYIDPDGNDDWDKIVGYIVGTATNIIPFPRSFRDLYTPTDAGDYNTALHNTDNAFTVVGEGMSNAGKGGAAVGVSIIATAGIAEVGSGGTATLVSTPAAAAGLELTEISVVTGLAGNHLKMNAASNSSKGYNRGKLGTPKDAYNEYKKGRAPKGIDRIDNPKDGQVHAHQKGKGATNADGTIHDKGKGAPKWPKK